MLNINITNFRKNIFAVLEQTIKYNEPIIVNTKYGNAVIVREEDYNGLVETIYLNSIAGMKERIIDGVNTPVSECITENEAKW